MHVQKKKETKIMHQETFKFYFFKPYEETHGHA